jgi:hypothetical protein
MRRLIHCLILLASVTASVTASATTYRWVDANGVTHYSDQPQPGATKIQLPPAQTYNSGAAAKAGAATVDDAPPGAAAGGIQPMLNASGCAITAPHDEQAFINISSLTVSAKGPSGGEVRLLLDGGLLQKGKSADFLISPVNRGMHTAVVVFTTIGGGELCRTQPVTFYVRKPSVIHSPVARH